MFRPMRVIAAQPPSGDAKYQHKEKKDSAYDLQKQDAAHAAKGFQESAQPARDSAAHARRCRAGLAAAHTRFVLGPLNTCTRSRMAGFLTREALTRHAARHAEPHT
jgi:hypothetical protein